MRKKPGYVLELLKSEDDHINKLHDIVRKAIEEESLITEKLSSEESDNCTFGQRLSDKVAEFGGSWRFIILFAGILLSWIVFNSIVMMDRSFDPYPYILLNLILSCLAAIQAPIIMMSQNRQEVKDRKRARNDYLVNLKSEIEIRHLHEKMDLSVEDQYKHICEIQQRQIEMLQQIINRLSRTHS
jgi:Predicted membrane protein